MSMIIDDQQTRISWSCRKCAVCGSDAICVNFGAPTCAPCKAFFRRNARQKEILEFPCQHLDTNLLIRNNNNNNKTINYLQIRQCSSCRLRRCFNIGMKKELVRTDEENIRHKQLVDRNRQRKILLEQKKQEKLLLIPQLIVQNNQYLHESDWRHLSNIVSAYDTYCLKTYVQQRSNMFNYETRSYSYESIPNKFYTTLPNCLTISLVSFLRSLPAFHSLSQINRTYLTKNNLRLLLFPNMFELNQICYSEPWQISLDNATFQLVCGPELYEQFVRTEYLTRKLLITDPIITRLWIIILFFSSSLSCLYDSTIHLKIPKKRRTVNDIQNAYVALLWNYLLHRYGNLSAVQIYSNIVHIYLKMQRVGFDIGIQIRTRNELLMINQTINQILTIDIQDK